MIDGMEYWSKVDQLITDITILCGYSLEELRDKFAEGWTLRPPEYLISNKNAFEEIAE